MASTLVLIPIVAPAASVVFEPQSSFALSRSVYGGLLFLMVFVYLSLSLSVSLACFSISKAHIYTCNKREPQVALSDKSLLGNSRKGCWQLSEPLRWVGCRSWGTGL